MLHLGLIEGSYIYILHTINNHYINELKKKESLSDVI
jgi:hypothetical protein